MGRRKQANPTKVADDYTTEASTSETTQPPTTNGLTNGKTASDKKSALNFSISAHLQPDIKSSNKVRKSSNPNDNSTSSVSYQTAQKAYQTLMTNLKQQEALMKSMGFGGNSAAAFFMNPFFGANMPSSFDFFSGLQSLTQKKKHKLEDNSVVDLSTKKKRSSDGKAPKQNESASNSALDKLSSLVTTVGNSPSPINSVMKMQNAVFGNSNANSDPTRVFTCLQCLERFQSMEELVNHMEKTLHFNQLKAFTNSSSSTNKAKSTTNSPAAKSPSPNDKARASSRGGTFSFECLICGHTSSGSIDEHMTTNHNFKTPNDWISAVKLIPL